MNSTANRNPTHDPERTAGGDGANFVAATYPGPFRCPLCATIIAVGHNFLEHMRVHGKEVHFLCGKCSKSWPTIHSVACHYSKCGRQITRSVRQPPVAVEDRPHTVVCTDCGDQFTTARGLQLHRRNAHIEQFNADRPREKKARWSQFEVLALAKLEVQLPSNIVNINQVLSKLLFEKHGLTRNVEMIKGQRRKSRPPMDKQTQLQLKLRDLMNTGL
ncbi:R2 protein [Trichuris trichiura]|uniref:R2 protein n=1 Tax=Trichuris trichiura TaxID=36087 RepID=A0A077ZM55_TRITR|nr:R2 protein [Trichuris trichiura]